MPDLLNHADDHIKAERIRQAEMGVRMNKPSKGRTRRSGCATFDQKERHSKKKTKVLGAFEVDAIGS